MTKTKTKLELEACRRIATAIREYAKTKGASMNQVAKEWRIHPATLDTLVGRAVRPAAANIPRGSTLQTIAQKTGRSLDWLLGLDDREYRDQTRAVVLLEIDVAAHVKRAIDTQLGPPDSIIGELRRWQVYGHNALQLAVDYTVLQAKAEKDPTLRIAVQSVVVRDEESSKRRA